MPDVVEVMKRWTFWLVILASAAVSAGCVERRYVITSDPPGAVVLENGRPLGATPVDGSFVYPGNYHFTLIRDGMETLQVDQPIPARWFDYFPLDFIAENMIPWRIKDVHRFHYPLPPQQAVRSDQVLNRAQQLRDRAAGIVSPPTPDAHSPPLPGPDAIP